MYIVALRPYPALPYASPATLRTASVTGGNVTSAKDQGSSGPAGLFSAINARILADHLRQHDRSGTVPVTKSYVNCPNFNLTISSTTRADPLGNTTGDNTRALYNDSLSNGDYLNRGGNSAFTAWAFASWRSATTSPQSQTLRWFAGGHSHAYNSSVAQMPNGYWTSL
jgi:hypothetical protein